MISMLKLILRKIPLLIITLVFFTSYSYVNWGTINRGNSSDYQEITIGDWYNVEHNDTSNLLDRLHSLTPSAVRAYLTTLMDSGNLSYQKLVRIIYTINDVIRLFPDYNIISATSIQGMFDYPNRGYIRPGDFLVYIEYDEIILMYVHHSASSNINNVDSLERELNNPWGSINIVSNYWRVSAFYHTFHAGITHPNQHGYLFFAMHNVQSEPMIGRHGWFRRCPNLLFDTRNTHLPGTIVQNELGEFFMARRHVSANLINSAPTWTATHWGWNRIRQWDYDIIFNGISVYSPELFSHDTLSFTKDYDSIGNYQIRFWQALRPSVTIEPSEYSAQLGYWREIFNSWIGPQNIVQSFYFPHNTYIAGSIVTYTRTLRGFYRYFRAIVDIAYNTPPLVYCLITFRWIVNSSYWEEIEFSR